MTTEDQATIKVTASPRGCSIVLETLETVFFVVKTSAIIKHQENEEAHFYATLIKKETFQ